MPWQPKEFAMTKSRFAAGLTLDLLRAVAGPAFDLLLAAAIIALACFAPAILASLG